jgi:hypothetical protein
MPAQAQTADANEPSEKPTKEAVANKNKNPKNQKPVQRPK